MGEEQDSAFERLLDRVIALSAEERAHVRELLVRPELVPPRRNVVVRGRTCDTAFVVQSGWLMKYRTLQDGSRQVLNFRLPGEIGGLECLAYLEAPHSVVTLTKCVIARISLEQLEATQREFPRLGTAMLLFSFREEAILHEWEISLGQRASYARLAHLVLELHSRLSARVLVDGPEFEFPPTQRDLAEAVGLTPPYVNRILRRMREDGLVEINGRRLRILDKEGLVCAANYSDDYLTNWQKRNRSP
ncbi:Crp/Fnr family transcriptional regulator [Micromonospora sp. STR1s_5]|nr:Crp/Fnr family transcriptional regulator [Micromonospora sp. STR1s_5]